MKDNDASQIKNIHPEDNLDGWILALLFSVVLQLFKS